MILVTSIFQGYMLGFLVAIPIGPIALICIRRILTRGIMSGVVSAAGCATAEAILAYLSRLGASLFATLLTGNQFLFRIVGSLFLLYLGISALFKGKQKVVVKKEFKTLTGDYSSTFFLSIINPLALAALAAVSALLGIKTISSTATRLTFGLGAFLGSFSWLMLICGITAIFQKKVNTNTLKRINVISGIVIIVCAAGFMAKVLWQMLQSTS